VLNLWHRDHFHSAIERTPIDHRLTEKRSGPMAAKPLHLGWFLQGSSAQPWGEPGTGHIGRTWMVPGLFADLAPALERACFDYVLIEDSSYVGESFRGSSTRLRK
jgi:hypothetical protein